MWASKKDAILEAEDLNLLSLQELIGSLLTHEMSMEIDYERDGKKKQKKDIVIAFKALKYIECLSESDDEEDDSDDMEHLTKRFCKFLNKKREVKKANKKKSKLIFYVCNELGHVKLDCPYLKKYRKRWKRRSLDDNSSSSDDDEVGQICLIAHADVIPFPLTQLCFDFLFIYATCLFIDFMHI